MSFLNSSLWLAVQSEYENEYMGNSTVTWKKIISISLTHVRNLCLFVSDVRCHNLRRISHMAVNVFATTFFLFNISVFKEFLNYSSCSRSLSHIQAVCYIFYYKSLWFSIFVNTFSPYSVAVDSISNILNSCSS